MAESGIGTDECLKEGCLPMKVHYYSPVPDIGELDRREVWSKISPLRGVKMNAPCQIEQLTEMAKKFSSECVWPARPTKNPHEFHYENSCFSFQCASLLHYMIRNFKPKRIIEAGSGLSSCVINSALEQNNKDGIPPCDYQIIDPFPSDDTKNLSRLTRITVQKIEEVPEKAFTELESGDILFIDSSHVSKIGSDVNFLILDVLPLLKPGVLIHFHDIPMPLEYARVYYTSPTFRAFWTESYLLQAFLAFNNEFEVLCATSYIQHHHPEALKIIFPNNPGGGSQSIWLRRALVSHPISSFT